MASRRAVGDVRPSQVITSFGPGAVVDLQTMSIIVAGIDRWPRNPEDAIHERRLQRALRVDSFFWFLTQMCARFSPSRSAAPWEEAADVLVPANQR